MAAAIEVDSGAVSDEEWLVRKARNLLKTDVFAAKAWLITATTLFPRNFSIQFEAYCIEKASKSRVEAARLLEEMYRTFSSESVLWTEVRHLCQALQSHSTEDSTVFLRELFAQLPASTQCQMLLKIVESSSDMMEQCQLMILLLNRFPDLVPEHGVRLLDQLLTTEKHAHLQTPINCYRKLIVHDVLPLVLKCRKLDVSSKQIHRWLQKSIEFYISYVTQPPGQESLPSPDFASPTKKVGMAYAGKRYPSIPGLPEKEAVIARPWDCLFDLVTLIGHQLGWQIGDLFSKTSRESQWQQLLALYHSIGQSETSSHVKQLLLCTTILFLDCLYQYSSRVEPDLFAGSGVTQQPCLVLVEKPNHGSGSESKPKKLKTDSHIPSIQPNPNVATSGVIIQNFLTAFKCWELLHSSEPLHKEFNKLLQHWRADTWRWLVSFEVDALMYQGNFQEAVNKLAINQISSRVTLQVRADLRLACCYYLTGKYSKSCDVILRIVNSIPHGINVDVAKAAAAPSGVSNGTAATASGRQLQLLSCTESELLPYCINLLRDCFMDKAFRTAAQDDTSLGHMIVLLQYDWPKQESLLMNILQKIKRQGSFTYRLFFNYIVNIDILEEFAYLKTAEGAKVNLDILPTSAKVLAQQRTVTRGVNKGVKEDFKVSLEKQVARSDENIETLIRQFLTEEKDLLQQNLL